MKYFKKYWWTVIISMAALADFIWKIKWFDQYNGSLMVVITIIYVGATILILKANNKTVEAAREQLKETNKQLEESKKV